MMLGYRSRVATLAVLCAASSIRAESPVPVDAAPAAVAEAPVAPPPPVAPVAAAPDPSEWKFAFHGFAGVSFYLQDTPSFVLNGQGPLLPLSQPSSGITTGADIRQSRFNLSVSGPKVFGAVPKAVLEIDLFGLDSPGGYGEVSVYSRVRLAYAELKWANDILRLGQDHELILGGIVPDSIAHQAYLSTYFNGQLGWREPGIGYFHNMSFGTYRIEVAAQLLKSDWQNPADFGTPTTNNLNVDYGQLSGYPAVEARVKYADDHVTAFIAGHYNRVAGSKASSLVIAPAAAPDRDWDVIAGVATVKASYFGVTAVASVYDGKNLGPLLGELLQFITTNDVAEWGGWVQVGYDVTKEISAIAIGGIARPNESEIAAAGGGRARDSMIGGMVRYKLSGFSFGPEFYHVVAKQITATGAGAPAGAGAPNGIIHANQFLLSGQYQF